MDSTLNHISQKTGEAYELVKFENVVDVSLSLMWLLTFVAKKPNSVPETFLSMVCQMPENEEVMECILKPDGEADWGANEDKVLSTYDFWNRGDIEDEDTDDEGFNEDEDTDDEGFN